ncbi:MAG: tetratricopeptide repeat protein, partial [Candidatus Latescibacteria bacterium]|nr:tetratricopeptide repeat protein [Candidatus Latescibacterota bacterium]
MFEKIKKIFDFIYLKGVAIGVTVAIIIVIGALLKNSIIKLINPTETPDNVISKETKSQNQIDSQHLKTQKIESDKSRWSLLGLIVHETEKTTIICDYQDGIAQSSNPNVVRMFAEGREHFLKKEYPQAISLYDHCLEIESDPEKRGAIHIQIGICYYFLGENEKSVNSYTTALVEANRADDKEGIAGTYTNRGNAYAKLDQYDKAIADYTKALDINPEYAIAFSNRGNAYSDSGNYETAIADFTKAIEINPRLVEAYYNRGTAYSGSGNYETAIADFTKAIEINPRLVKAYYNRGVAYLDLGNYETAIADFSKALDINPQFAEAFGNRGNAFLDLGNYETAIADFTKALDINPQFAEAYNNRGTAYLDLGNYETAIADFSKALDINPRLAEAFGNRGV